MNAKTTTLTAALVLALAGGLVAGCSSNATEAPAPTATATAEAPDQAETPIVEPTPEAPAPAAVGDVITAEQAEALPAGQRTYAMADGSLVVIDDAAPLPEAVRAEMIAPIVELVAQFPSDDVDRMGAAKSEVSDAIVATTEHGRTFYVIVSYEADAGTFYTALSRDDGKFLFNGVMSKDEAIRLAQEQADRINNADRRLGEFIEVIVP